MPAAIRIDSVAVSIQYGYTIDVDIIASKKTNAVVGRIDNCYVANGDVLTAFEGDGFRPTPFLPIPINCALTDN